jgi:hypothetical protein
MWTSVFAFAIAAFLALTIAAMILERMQDESHERRA